MRRKEMCPVIIGSLAAGAEVHAHEATDALLTTAAQSGNAAAFVELSLRHSRRIKSRIYRMLRNWEDAEDVLQDSLLRAFTHIGQFRGECTFSTWLTGIAINLALMVLRKRQGHTLISLNSTTSPTGSLEVWEQLPDHSPNQELLFADREVEELLHGAVQRLPLYFRSVIELYHDEERSANQVANKLGISVPATKSRLMRARMALRTSLAGLQRQAGSV